MGDESKRHLRAVIRAHQEQILFDRARWCLWATIVGLLVLWLLGATRILARSGPSLPLANGIELCFLVAVAAEVHRPWWRRHILALCRRRWRSS